MIHGFRLLRTQYIKELETEARLYRHERTEAQLLSLINTDENKVFGISFRTPPRDSTGVAHILEHSVLCGSRKYPAKEPFVELLKGSLKTFLNAFTYPDKTCYPVASLNVRDFHNLVDVYLDAVFYPLITPFIFQQEGWHYELESPDAPLTYKGVVYNEMKGAYSSPDTVLAEYSQQSLFPDNTYGLDSGGNPTVIPDLTYEDFKAFHEKYYHPSNSRIYFYGDDDPEERLRLLNEYLSNFGAFEVDSSVGLQPQFSAPVRIVRSFASGGAASGGEGGSPKGMITVNWLLPETLDPELNLSFQILQYILLGMPASPLRKALIDSGLGDDIAGTGLENELRQAYFSTGLKGIDPENADKVEKLILDTLEGLAREGIDPITVEAAVNTIEFRLRENNSGSYPQGLILMLRALTTWLYDGDPSSMIAFEKPLSSVKSRIADDPGFFRKLIDRHFLENTHRTTLALNPDPQLADKEDAEERRRLAVAREAMNPDELRAVLENTAELKRRQETPDPPEVLATIPTLKIADLDRLNKIIPCETVSESGPRVLYHDIVTNGVFYLDVGFNLRLLPQRFLPYVPLLGRAFVEMGTEREDFVSLTRRISRKTGGIRPEIFTSTVANGGGESAAWLILRGKCMLSQVDDLLDILRDTILTVRLSDRERLRQMALEEKAKQEQKLVPGGHQMINLRLRSHFSEADWANERMAGISYLLFLRRLIKDIDENASDVLGTFEETRRLLVNRKSMIFNSVFPEANRSSVCPKLRGFGESLPSGPVSFTDWRPDRFSELEGLIVPAQVNYVGKGASLYGSGYVFHGSAQVISGYLRSTWLWEKIRVQGGAYGAMCLFDRLSGIMTFVSYRDPNVIKTLENFDRTSEFLRTAELSEDEIRKAVIGAVGVLDTHLLPDAKGYVSMLRKLSGDTDEARQKMREEILSTSVSDFRKFADALDEVREKGIVKVLGPETSLEKAVTDGLSRPQILRVL